MSKELEDLGYKYDEDADCYVKDLFFDLNELNKQKGLAVIAVFDNRVETYKGKLFSLCPNGNEIIEIELSKITSFFMAEEK